MRGYPGIALGKVENALKYIIPHQKGKEKKNVHKDGGVVSGGLVLRQHFTIHLFRRIAGERSTKRKKVESGGKKEYLGGIILPPYDEVE